MSEQQVKDVIATLDRVAKKLSNDKKATKKFLEDAGILKLIATPEVTKKK